MKKVIRLTEGDLHDLINESVTRIINEIGVYPNGQIDLNDLARLQKIRLGI